MVDNGPIHKRVPIAGSADLSFHGSEGNILTKAIISNVSLSGIAIYADREIEDGTDVSIDMNFIALNDVMKNTHVKGHVVYTREMGTFFFTGVEFTEEISSEKHHELYDYIQQALKWY